ncbi:PIN domain-containing protein [Candidatus Nomurabacteria bacterium]|nr:PIN domain-containing protein [Candidatus Nomurabacteria bacterium]
MYLLDSNILINFLNGSKEEVDWINNAKKNNEFLGFSVISKIETLSLTGLREEKVQDIENFLNLFSESHLSNDIALLSARLRRSLKLSLGDGIILATAISRRMTLVTNDRTLIKKAKNLVEVLSI